MSLNNKKYNYIYRTWHKDLPYYYIGRHSTNDLQDGYKGSGTILKRCFKKYGKSTFITDILYMCESFEELCELEDLILDKDFIENKYNINISASSKNAVLFGKRNPWYGRKLHENAIKAMIETNKRKVGELNHFYGRNHTEETKKKLSENAKRLNELNGNPFKGKKHSSDTIRIISDKNKKRWKDSNFRENMVSKFRERLQKFKYHTPTGIFESAMEVSKVYSWSLSATKTRFGKNCDKRVGFNHQISEEYRGELSWRELGFYRIPI